MSSSARYLSLKEAAALAEVPEDTILFWKKERLLKFIENSSEILFCKRLLLRRLEQKESLPLPGASKPVPKVKKEKVQKKKVSSPKKKVERKVVQRKKSSRPEYSIQPLFEDEGFCRALSTLTPLAKDLEWKKNSGWFWSTCGRFVICPGPGKGEEGTAELWSQSGNKRGTLLSTWAHVRNAKIWAKRLSVQRQWR